MKPRYIVGIAAIIMVLLIAGAVRIGSERINKQKAFCTKHGMVLVHSKPSGKMCVKGMNLP